MVIVDGKTVDFQGIAGFMMGLKPDIISMYLCLSTQIVDHNMWYYS